MTVVLEWYGVCNFVVLSVVEVCVDYGGVNVFHVCLHFLRRVCHDQVRSQVSRGC